MIRIPIPTIKFKNKESLFWYIKIQFILNFIFLAISYKDLVDKPFTNPILDFNNLGIILTGSITLIPVYIITTGLIYGIYRYSLELKDLHRIYKYILFSLLALEAFTFVRFMSWENPLTALITDQIRYFIYIFVVRGLYKGMYSN